MHVNPIDPCVSVVIPAYNEEALLPQTLASLRCQTVGRFELIVVNNHSTDRTAAVARRFGARVVDEPCKGVRAARQRGFLAARGPIIATTNADTVVPPDWLETIVRAFDADNALVGFGGLTQLRSGPHTAIAGYNALVYPFMCVDKLLSDGWNLVGANMAVRREAFLQVGGFHTDLVLGEDVALVTALRAVGMVRLDRHLRVHVSGRRFRHGLIAGVLTYAPYWLVRVVSGRVRGQRLPDIRNEDGCAPT